MGLGTGGLPTGIIKAKRTGIIKAKRTGLKVNNIGIIGEGTSIWTSIEPASMLLSLVPYRPLVSAHPERVHPDRVSPFNCSQVHVLKGSWKQSFLCNLYNSKGRILPTSLGLITLDMSIAHIFWLYQLTVYGLLWPYKLSAQWFIIICTINMRTTCII